MRFAGSSLNAPVPSVLVRIRIIGYSLTLKQCIRRFRLFRCAPLAALPYLCASAACLAGATCAALPKLVMAQAGAATAALSTLRCALPCGWRSHRSVGFCTGPQCSLLRLIASPASLLWLANAPQLICMRSCSHHLVNISRCILCGQCPVRASRPGLMLRPRARNAA